MKMKTKVKNKLHRYGIIRTRPRHSYKYTKYKTCLSMIMVMCNKQHLSSEAEFTKTLSGTEAELKKALLIKERVLLFY